MIDHLRAGDADGSDESGSPAMPGDPRRVGSMVKFGGQISVSEAKILDAEGKLLASGDVYLTTPTT